MHAQSVTDRNLDSRDDTLADYRRMRAAREHDIVASKELLESPSRRVQSFDNMKWLALLAVAAIVAISMGIYRDAQDNDMWWLFATGKEIIEHGIPYLNPFSAFGDQAIVIQQWLASVIDYLFYSSFGFIGIGVMVLLLTVVLAIAYYHLAKTIMGVSPSVFQILALALVIGCAKSYLSVRPQVWAMIAYVCVLIVLERYRKTRDFKVLIALPLITMIHINLHMALALFDLVIIAAYMLPILGVFESCNEMLQEQMKHSIKDHLKWCLPLFIALFASALSMLINPYGIDGILYIFSSYGSAEYGNTIREMGALSVWGKPYGWCMVGLIVLGAASIGHAGLSKAHLPLIFLYTLAIIMAFQHVRNVWLVAPFAYALFAYAWPNLRPSTNIVIFQDDKFKMITSCLASVAIAIYGFITFTPTLDEQPKDSPSTPVAAVEYLNENVSNPGETTVLTHFNTGGYLEYYGYLVSMDARPELWDSALSKNGIDRYKEYIDMIDKKLSMPEFMSTRMFDYAIVNDDTELSGYIGRSLDYQVVLDGNEYKLFKRRDIPLLDDETNTVVSIDVDKDA